MIVHHMNDQHNISLFPGDRCEVPQPEDLEIPVVVTCRPSYYLAIGPVMLGLDRLRFKLRRFLEVSEIQELERLIEEEKGRLALELRNLGTRDEKE